MKVSEVIKPNETLPLEKEAIINLIMSSHVVNNAFNKALKEFKLSLQQFNVLRILKGQSGKPANLKCIQERMVTKMSNTTRLIDKLIEKGFVERYICPENRREIQVFITKKGINILDNVSPILENKEKLLTKNISQEELEKLNTILNKIRNNE